MAANETVTGNVAMKLHVFAQWKTPSIGTDVLPGSKGTKSETDVELPGVFGDEQTPQNS
jgi:phage baseplate assembly protein gpV